MVSFTTSSPNALLATLKKAIDNGKVVTWTYNKDGYFTHTPDQWKGKGWFLPSTSPGSLRFGLVRPQNGSIGTEVYAVYHGRFLEMMLAHFDTEFSEATASALGANIDQLKAA